MTKRTKEVIDELSLVVLFFYKGKNRITELYTSLVITNFIILVYCLIFIIKNWIISTWRSQLYFFNHCIYLVNNG